ncbi:MAG: hypothetical protein JXQ29_01720 [Planctomycetes bacterium]|nr:hypothetical protein [Planctomycetota bacterium]
MKCAPGQSGATLVEVAISLALLVIALIPALGSMQATMTAQQHLSTQEVLEERVRRAGEQVAFQLRGAGLETLQDVPEAPESSQSIRYRSQIGFDPATGPSFGDEMQILFSDGSLRWSSSAFTTVLAQHLTNATFDREGRSVRVRVRADATDPKGDRIHVERTTHVTLEN